MRKVVMMKTKILKIASMLTIIMVLLLVAGAPLVAAKAEVYYSRVKYPADYSVWHYCYGEQVHWVGYIQWISKTTIDNNGGSHVQYHGLSKLTGIGQESGVKYEALWTDNSSRQLVGPGPWEFSDTYNYTAVAQGTGRVLTYKSTWITTISTTGEWSSYLADERWFCEADTP
jgi:hypothetical protein